MRMGGGKERAMDKETEPVIVGRVEQAIRQLMTPPDPPPKPIGFHVRESGVRLRYGIRNRRREA